MTNPALAEMAARDHIAELRRAAGRRSVARAAETTAVRTARPRGNPQRTIGWFLISVGLRLAVPPSRAGSAR